MPYEHKLTIKQWAEEDRPREKLLLKGKNALSNAELLAIIIGSGNAEQSAVQLCQDILSRNENNLNKLSELQVPDFLSFKGIGEAKALSITACLELGRRRLADAPIERPQIRSSKAAFNIFYPYLADLLHEEFWVCYVNRGHKVLKVEQHTQGGTTGTVVDNRILLKKALQYNAVGLFVAHNHPSGRTRPSNADIQLTKKLKKAAALLEIQLIDHIIVAGNKFYSFADEGMMM